MAEAQDARLEERISGGEAPWFPGLAASLAYPFRHDASRAAWTDYSTADQLGAPVSSSDRLATIDLGGGAPALLERLPPSLQRHFPGLKFVADPPAATIVAEITRATHGLASATGVRDAVSHLVRTVHVVAPAGPGYDCSHSDPALPLSIFVSVPLGERDATLRLAESILHEAMHLQLSLIERQIVLAHEGHAEIYSPWQHRPRPVSGLVHGLYVFACILGWLDALSEELRLAPTDRRYVERRRAEILEEIEQVISLPMAPGLTPLGRRLSRWLIAGSLGARFAANGA